jgi:hypothetical protein
MDKYKLIFRGQLKEGKSQAVIGKFLCKFLGLAESNAEKLFSGRAYSLKSNLAQQQAYELQGKLDVAGIITDVIREKPLQNEVTYQERVVQTEQGRESVAEPDYKVKLGDKTLCRHCGSHLIDPVSATNSVPTQSVIVTHQNLPSTNQTVSEYAEISLDAIEALDISDWWKERFVILHTSGASQKSLVDYVFSPEGKLALKSGSKKIFSIKAWIIGYFIGPIIYFFKGMHRKGFTLLLLNALINLIISAIAYAFDLELSIVVSMLIGATIVNIFYVYDYYKYRIHNETFWPQLPKWIGHGVVIAIGWIVIIGLHTLLVMNNL